MAIRCKCKIDNTKLHKLMPVLHFHCQMVMDLAKMLLFLEYIIIQQCMSIIKKDVLILRKTPTDQFHHTTTTVETEYSGNFPETKKTVLCMLMLQKAKDSKIKPYPLCLSSISKIFTNDMLKKLDQVDTYLFFYKNAIMIILMLVKLWIFTIFNEKHNMKKFLD